MPVSRPLGRWFDSRRRAIFLFFVKYENYLEMKREKDDREENFV